MKVTATTSIALATNTLEITYSASIHEETMYGNIKTGKMELLEFYRFRFNGKLISEHLPKRLPTPTTEAARKAQQDAVGRLGNMLLRQAAYDAIVAAIQTLVAETRTPEMDALAAEEEAAKEAQKLQEEKELIQGVASAHRSGACPKCGTYCYGDCE